MQRHLIVKNRRRAVPWNVVQKRPAARELIFKVRQLAAAAAWIYIIPAAHGEGDAAAGGHDD